jgi:hypothetical protein
VWHSISAALTTDRAVAVVLTTLVGILLSVTPARAQQSGRQTAPVWGQLGTPAWGQYQGRIGVQGWQYNRTLQPSVPEGAILNPNQTTGGPSTGSLFTPPDTRLLGRIGP